MKKFGQEQEKLAGQTKDNLKKDLSHPWLVQRCQIKSKPAVNKKFSECARLDYMGSAEFEFGAIPQLLVDMNQIKEDLVVTKYKAEIPRRPQGLFHVDMPKQLFILSLPNQAEDYQVVLKDLINEKTRTKEVVFHGENDLWIDLNNKVMFSTDKQILEKMHHLLKSSAEFILENRRKAAEAK